MLENVSDSIEVDFLIVADRAEVLTGKLYMMGGGWDSIGTTGPDQPVHFTAAVGFLVPWNATNVDHPCTIRLEDADGTDVLSLGYTIRTGRPPNLPEGATQRVTVSLPIAAAFPQPGVYALVATAGTDQKRTSFHVRQVPAPTPQPYRPPQS
jgi:hypothetical protein